MTSPGSSPALSAGDEGKMLTIVAALSFVGPLTPRYSRRVVQAQLTVTQSSAAAYLDEVPLGAPDAILGIAHEETIAGLRQKHNSMMAEVQYHKIDR